jgi:hypothetical protein
MIERRTDPMRLEMTLYWLPKSDSASSEFEDAAVAAEADGLLAVADGATEAYDARRWVDTLTQAFVAAPPALQPSAMAAWVSSAQQRFQNGSSRQFASIFDEHQALRTGAFGTLLGVRFTNGDGHGWQAVSVGDVVLFHVRRGQLHQAFPAMAAADFGTTPGLVHASPARLDATIAALRFGHGMISPADVLLVATDALAHWALARHERRQPAWEVLAELDHVGFEQLIRDLRASGELNDDDVTLAVVRAREGPA